LDEAKAKGMHVVDNNKLADSYKDFEIEVAKADALAEQPDPEETPYLSKYKARDILDMLCSRLEANRTIASLEKDGKIVYETNWRIAALRVRLGSLAWEVEEPHNTQVELELAAEFYCPGFIGTINDMSGEVGTDAAKDMSHDMEPPSIESKHVELCADVMKCMNMMGILWAGRDHVKRSFLYLLAAKQFYDETIQKELSDKNREEMESTLTLNLFYLAQAYGFIGNTELSALYCHMTLQRQLMKGFGGLKDVLSWCSNCMGMADFHIALADFKSAAHALGVTEHVLRKHLQESSAEKDDNTSDKVAELEADINRRWIRLDMTVLKKAVDNIGYMPTEEQKMKVANTRFLELTVDEPSLLGEGDIQTFEAAREVFLRCTARLEKAKTMFPMDGYVTDHVNLVREHANMFHYLASFETDIKRKLAMELRRVELLKVFLNINRTAFEVFHKEMSYELGEAYMTMYELKLEKIAQKNPTIFQHADKAMKLADKKKCNEYCVLTIAMFSHFLSMYTLTPEQMGVSKNFIDMTADELASIPLLRPKGADSINHDEIRPFLNAIFFIARMLTKILPLPDCAPNERAKNTIAGLKRYEWLTANADDICALKEGGAPVEEIFKQEMEICREMIGLLPQKISRMHYLGEGGMI